jgi:hypothetical protein
VDFLRFSRPSRTVLGGARFTISGINEAFIGGKRHCREQKKIYC